MFRFADGVDDSGGHGTHVSGILAADPLNEPLHRGLAYAAKLAFFDLGAASVQAWISAPVGLDSRCGLPPAATRFDDLCPVR